MNEGVWKFLGIEYLAMFYTWWCCSCMKVKGWILLVGFFKRIDFLVGRLWRLLTKISSLFWVLILLCLGLEYLNVTGTALIISLTRTWWDPWNGWKCDKEDDLWIITDYVYPNRSWLELLNCFLMFSPCSCGNNTIDWFRSTIIVGIVVPSSLETTPIYFFLELFLDCRSDYVLTLLEGIK